MDKPTKKTTKKPKKKVQQVVFDQQINLDEDVPDIPKGNIIVDDEFILQKKYDYDKAQKQRQFISTSTEKLLLEKQVVQEKEVEDNLKNIQKQVQKEENEEQKPQILAKQVDVQKQENQIEIVKAEMVKQQIQVKNAGQTHKQQESDLLFQDSKLQMISNKTKPKEKLKTNKSSKNKASKKQSNKNVISQINLEQQLIEQAVIPIYQQKTEVYTNTNQQPQLKNNQQLEKGNRQQIKAQQETINLNKVQVIDEKVQKLQIIQSAQAQIRQQTSNNQIIHIEQKLEEQLLQSSKEDEIEEAIIIQKINKPTIAKSGKKKKQSKKKNLINISNNIDFLTIQTNEIEQLQVQQNRNNSLNTSKDVENNLAAVICQLDQQINTENKQEHSISDEIVTEAVQNKKQSVQINLIKNHIDETQIVPKQILKQAQISQQSHNLDPQIISTELSSLQQDDHAQIFEQTNLKTNSSNVSLKSKKKGKKTTKKIQKTNDKFAPRQLNFDQIDQKVQNHQQKQQQLHKVQNKQQIAPELKIQSPPIHQKQGIQEQKVVKHSIIQQQQVQIKDQGVLYAQKIENKQEQAISNLVTPTIEPSINQTQEIIQDFHINLSGNKQVKQQKGKSSKAKKNSKKTTTKKQRKGSDIKLSSITFQQALQQQIADKSQIIETKQRKQEQIQIQNHHEQQLQAPCIEKEVPSKTNQQILAQIDNKISEERIEKNHCDEEQKQKIQIIVQLKGKQIQQKIEENIEKIEEVQLFVNNTILPIEVKQKKPMKKKGTKKQGKKQKNTTDQFMLLQEQPQQQNYQPLKKMVKIQTNDTNFNKKSTFQQQQIIHKDLIKNELNSINISQENLTHVNAQSLQEDHEIKVDNLITKAEQNIFTKEQEEQKPKIQQKVQMLLSQKNEAKNDDSQHINDEIEEPIIQFMISANSSQINKLKAKKAKKNVKKGNKNNVIEPLNFLQEIEKINEELQIQIPINMVQEKIPFVKQTEVTIEGSNFENQNLSIIQKRQNQEIASKQAQQIEKNTNKQSLKQEIFQQKKNQPKEQHFTQAQMPKIAHQEKQFQIQREEPIKHVNNREQVNQQIQIMQIDEIKVQQNLFSASKGKKKAKGTKAKPKIKQSNMNSKQEYFLEDQQPHDDTTNIKYTTQALPKVEYSFHKQHQQKQNNQIVNIKPQIEQVKASSIIKQEKQFTIKPQQKQLSNKIQQKKPLQVSKKAIVSELIGLIRFHNDEQIKIMRERMQMLQQDIISRLTRSQKIPKAKQIATDYQEIIQENIALSKELQSIYQV